MALCETRLEYIRLSGAMGPPVRVTDLATERATDATLVMDVGNSRMTGVTAETSPLGGTRLTNCGPC
ncbi:MAG: hypothetical protein LBT40_09355 [Deltaproteobacteria bacterium]|jgi:hypothetical protein|nr:hypothetical protein [Deltaproteobacteria bacterium]